MVYCLHSVCGEKIVILSRNVLTRDLFLVIFAVQDASVQNMGPGGDQAGTSGGAVGGASEYCLRLKRIGSFGMFLKLNLFVFCR